MLLPTCNREVAARCLTYTRHSAGTAAPGRSAAQHPTLIYFPGGCLVFPEKEPWGTSVNCLWGWITCKQLSHLEKAALTASCLGLNSYLSFVYFTVTCQFPGSSSERCCHVSHRDQMRHFWKAVLSLAHFKSVGFPLSCDILRCKHGAPGRHTQFSGIKALYSGY